MRLDRFLCNATQCSRRDVSRLLAQERVMVEGGVVVDRDVEIDEFTQVSLDGMELQARQARYFMMHKPPGCVSATRDPAHRTVFDLLNEPRKDELHIGGRLDFNTSGLLLITNNGRWSRRITQPEEKIPKVYRVTTEDSIAEGVADVFARGMYFKYENITTQPARLEILTEREARLTIYEGRYHQVKRMFGHFNNKVVKLHRESVGTIVLDRSLAEGAYRALTVQEIAMVAGWGKPSKPSALSARPVNFNPIPVRPKGVEQTPLK